MKLFLFLLFVGPAVCSFGFFGDISFDKTTTSAPPKEKNLTETNIIEISDDIFGKLDGVSDLKSLQSLLGIPSKPTFIPDIMIGHHLRKVQSDRYLDNPQQAHCEPEDQPVHLGLISTKSVTYFPTCIRVKRCGGCCRNRDLFSCQPTASDKLTVKVLELREQKSSNVVSRGSRRGRRRRNSSKYEYNSVDIPVEIHTECKCMCELRESNCDLSVHYYNEQSCQCICKNADEEEKCREMRSHLWSKKSCQCLCRRVMECSSSETFDHTTCSCIPTKTSVPYREFLLRSTKPNPPTRSRKPLPGFIFV